eukprot:9989619-Alexandrium_andersonii.AAC.1
MHLLNGKAHFHIGSAATIDLFGICPSAETEPTNERLFLLPMLSMCMVTYAKAGSTIVRPRSGCPLC